MRASKRWRNCVLYIVGAALSLAGVSLSEAAARAADAPPTTVADLGVFYPSYDYSSAAGGSMGGITRGADGNFWAAVSDVQNYIIVFSPTSHAIVTRYPIGPYVSTMVTGPDGQVWFVENGVGPNGAQSAIAEIDTSGTITSHLLPVADGSDVGSLTFDAAGDAWFLAEGSPGDNGLGYVGYLAPDESVTQFAMPYHYDAENADHELAIARNGSAWFIGNIAGTVRVGSVSPAGVFAYQGLPGDTANTTDQMVLAPDGHLWFDAGHLSHSDFVYDLGEIDPATGAQTLYQMPANFSGGFLSVGADGTVYDAGTIGPLQHQSGTADDTAIMALTPTDGHLGEFTGSDTFSPQDIATDSAGNLWMNQGSMFAELTLNAPHSTAMTIAPDANPAYYGQPGGVTVTLAPNEPGAPVPTGTVTFSARQFASVTEPVVNGTATLPIADLPLGLTSLDATYSGDAAYGPESSDLLQETVNSSPTTLTLAASPNPAAAGQAVHVTATVTMAGGSAPKCCSVQFSVDSGSVQTVPLTGSTAAIDLPSLSVGAHTVKADFADQPGYGSSTATLAETVNVADPCPCTVFPDSATPAVADTGDGSAVELGTKVQVSAAGNITGVRFYKAAGNAGPHTGSLWASDGTLLATGTFSDESASGWQTLTFASPVAVRPGATYIASYYAPHGHYSADGAFFASGGAGTGPITALADSSSGGNGVYAYAPASAFPSNSYNATNYWVDAVFDAAGVPTGPQTVTGTTPEASAAGVADTVAPTATFSAALDPASLHFVLTDAAGTGVPAVVTYDAASRTATLTPSTQLPSDTAFTASVTATDAWGHAMVQPAGWTFTTGTTPPAYSCPCALFAPGDTPAVANSGEYSSVELGVRFTAAIDGSVTGIRFYKGTSNTGIHTGSLWTADGTQLATGTFSNESASGWQTLTFANPVAITAGTTYVASYHAPNGNYSYTTAYFDYPHMTYPLTAPAGNHPPTGNGVFAYEPGTAYPVESSSGNNYWVSPVFVPAG